MDKIKPSMMCSDISGKKNHKQLFNLWLIFLSSSTKSSTCSFIHSARLTMCNVYSIQLCAKIQEKQPRKPSDLHTKHRKCKFSIYTCVGSVATYTPIPKWPWFRTAEWQGLLVIAPVSPDSEGQVGLALSPLGSEWAALQSAGYTHHSPVSST